MGRLLGTLIVIVIKARNLVNKARIGKQDPFCTISINSDKKRTPAVKKGGQTPTWDTELRFEIWQDASDEVSSEITATGGVKPASQPSSISSSTSASRLNKAKETPLRTVTSGPGKGQRLLRVAVYADDPRDPDLVGEAEIDIAKVLKVGEYDDWIEIANKGRMTGEVKVEMTFYSADPEPARKHQKQASDGVYAGPGVFEPVDASRTQSPARSRPVSVPSRADLDSIPPHLRPGSVSSMSHAAGSRHSISSLNSVGVGSALSADITPQHVRNSLSIGNLTELGLYSDPRHRRTPVGDRQRRSSFNGQASTAELPQQSQAWSPRGSSWKPPQAHDQAVEASFADMSLQNKPLPTPSPMLPQRQPFPTMSPHQLAQSATPGHFQQSGLAPSPVYGSHPRPLRHSMSAVSVNQHQNVYQPAEPAPQMAHMQQSSTADYRILADPARMASSPPAMQQHHFIPQDYGWQQQQPGRPLPHPQPGAASPVYGSASMRQQENIQPPPRHQPSPLGHVPDRQPAMTPVPAHFANMPPERRHSHGHFEPAQSQTGGYHDQYSQVQPQQDVGYIQHPPNQFMPQASYEQGRQHQQSAGQPNYVQHLPARSNLDMQHDQQHYRQPSPAPSAQSYNQHPISMRYSTPQPYMTQQVPAIASTASPVYFPAPQMPPRPLATTPALPPSTPYQGAQQDHQRPLPLPQTTYEANSQYPPSGYSYIQQQAPAFQAPHSQIYARSLPRPNSANNIQAAVPAGWSQQQYQEHSRQHQQHQQSY